MNLPLGFRYAAAYAGIRKEERDDVALIVAGRPAPAAALFTRNLVQAAPVQVAKQHLRKSGGHVSALIVNAGNANCATRTGVPVATATAKAVAAALKTKAEYVLPASTGVIGVELDPSPLLQAIPTLAENLSPDKFDDVARAIMTTDTRAKTASEEVAVKGGVIRIAGMTKGSGMIHPNMATTLCFVVTDAVLSPAELRQMLKPAVESSFNSLSVDGDMSTNDMVALLAGGASKLRGSGTNLKAVSGAVTRVLETLAAQIAADGEGARKLVVIEASGFRSDDEARRAARAIANSPLVKTAIAGSDPNWGRILSAAGYSGANFDPRRVTIHLQNTLVCRDGLAVELDEAALKRRLDSHQVDIRFEVKSSGKGHARFFTCDLTEGYIRINGSYRT